MVTLHNAIHFDASTPTIPKRCAVPGCNAPPFERQIGGVPLCEKHRVCPRCGIEIHTHGRGALDCCGLAVPLIARRSWVIPWHRFIRRGYTAQTWPHKVARARVLIGRSVACSGLPYPVEVPP